MYISYIVYDIYSYLYMLRICDTQQIGFHLQTCGFLQVRPSNIERSQRHEMVIAFGKRLLSLIKHGDFAKADGKTVINYFDWFPRNIVTWTQIIHSGFFVEGKT